MKFAQDKTLPELLPCPWCGGPAAVDWIGVRLPFWDLPRAYYVKCQLCSAESPGDQPTQLLAATVWNRRARQAAVTVIGLVIALGLLAAIICGLLWLGAKLLDAGRTIEARREYQLTNEIDKLTLVLDRNDPVLDRLYELAEIPEPILAPTALDEAPEVEGEEEGEMSDVEFLAWADGIQTWAILRRESLSLAWEDTGNRINANATDLPGFLLELAQDEAVYASVGATKDGLIHPSAFYTWCLTNEVPIKPEDK